MAVLRHFLDFMSLSPGYWIWTIQTVRRGLSVRMLQQVPQREDQQQQQQRRQQ